VAEQVQPDLLDRMRQMEQHVRDLRLREQGQGGAAVRVQTFQSANIFDSLFGTQPDADTWMGHSRLSGYTPADRDGDPTNIFATVTGGAEGASGNDVITIHEDGTYIVVARLNAQFMNMSTGIMPDFRFWACIEEVDDSLELTQPKTALLDDGISVQTYSPVYGSGADERHFYCGAMSGVLQIAAGTRIRGAAYAISEEPGADISDFWFLTPGVPDNSGYPTPWSIEIASISPFLRAPISGDVIGT
jgi:hypothetical protein